MRKRLVLRVDNPQHAFAFTANTGDVEPLVFLIENHFTDVGLFIIRELERFHFFVGAGIQQGNEPSSALPNQRMWLASSSETAKGRRWVAIRFHLQRVSGKQEHFAGGFIFIERGADAA
jgi:hypothetical protein